MRFFLPLFLAAGPLFVMGVPALSLPNPRESPTLPETPRDGSKLGDWISGPNTLLSSREGVLSVVSSGNDPYFHSGVLPPMRGPYFVEFRASSNLNGPLEIFWRTTGEPGFDLQNKVAVGDAKVFDGKYRHFLVELPQNVIVSLHSLRIDPGTSSGEALFEFIRIRSMTGKIYQEWKGNK